MPWVLLTALLGVTECEPWLVAQVERARVRGGVPPVTLSCPEPGVAVVEGEASRAVRLSGFEPGDRWVGTALIALVQAQAPRASPQGLAPSNPAPLPDVVTAADAPEPSLRLRVRPVVAVLGSPLQLEVGAEGLVALGGFWVGVGLGRQQVTAPKGHVSATDLMLVASAPLVLWRGGALALVLEPGLAAGLSRLDATASAGATASAAWSPCARVWVGVGLEARGLPLDLELSLGVRGGLRVAPAGTADGVEVLAGTAASGGATLGLGWSR